jgi:hypothetical protein
MQVTHPSLDQPSTGRAALTGTKAHDMTIIHSSCLQKIKHEHVNCLVMIEPLDRPIDQWSWDRHCTGRHRQPVKTDEEKVEEAAGQGPGALIFIPWPSSSTRQGRSGTTTRRCGKQRIKLPAIFCSCRHGGKSCSALHRDSEGKGRVTTWTVPFISRSCRVSCGPEFLVAPSSATLYSKAPMMCAPRKNILDLMLSSKQRWLL